MPAVRSIYKMQGLTTNLLRSALLSIGSAELTSNLARNPPLKQLLEAWIFICDCHRKRPPTLQCRLVGGDVGDLPPHERRWVSLASGHWGWGQGSDPPRKQLLTGVGGSRLRVRGGGGDVAVIRSERDPPCEQLLAGMCRLVGGS